MQDCGYDAHSCAVQAVFWGVVNVQADAPFLDGSGIRLLPAWGAFQVACGNIKQEYAGIQYQPPHLKP